MAGPAAAVRAVLAVPRIERGVQPVLDRLFGTLPVVDRVARPLVPEGRHRVSVVVPSYGYARFLPAAIGSAATQEGVDVEVIVVDDCGPDESLAVARAEAARHPDGVVQVLANERNLGHMESFDRGCRAATGDFLVRLDADDLLVPGALARAVAVMEACPEVGLVYGRVRIFSGADPVVPDDTASSSAVVYRGEDWLRRSVSQGRNLITTPEALTRTAVLHEVGAWRGDLAHSQDLEAWLRVASASDVAHIDGAVQACKRDHPANQSNTVGMVGLQYYVSHVDALDALFAAVAHRLDDPEGLLRAGRRALADEAVDEVVALRRRGAGDDDLVAELEALAASLGPSPAAVRRLERGRALGVRAPRDPGFAVRAARQALVEEARWAHWRVRGL